MKRYEHQTNLHNPWHNMCLYRVYEVVSRLGTFSTPLPEHIPVGMALFSGVSPGSTWPLRYGDWRHCYVALEGTITFEGPCTWIPRLLLTSVVSNMAMNSLLPFGGRPTDRFPTEDEEQRPAHQGFALEFVGHCLAAASGRNWETCSSFGSRVCFPRY